MHVLETQEIPGLLAHVVRRSQVEEKVVRDCVVVICLLAQGLLEEAKEVRERKMEAFLRGDVIEMITWAVLSFPLNYDITTNGVYLLYLLSNNGRGAAALVL